jgi:hypothetical protein
MAWRQCGVIDLNSLAILGFVGLFGYSAWLTSIVFCASHGLRPLLVASAAFFPVGIVHGIGVWFGGW